MRYLVIDTEQELPAGVKQWLENMLRHKAVMSEEESLAKFKEVFDEGFDTGSSDPSEYARDYSWKEFKEKL